MAVPVSSILAASCAAPRARSAPRCPPRPPAAGPASRGCRRSGADRSGHRSAALRLAARCGVRRPTTGRGRRCGLPSVTAASLMVNDRSVQGARLLTTPMKSRSNRSTVSTGPRSETAVTWVRPTSSAQLSRLMSSVRMVSRSVPCSPAGSDRVMSEATYRGEGRNRKSTSPAMLTVVPAVSCSIDAAIRARFGVQSTSPGANSRPTPTAPSVTVMTGADDDEPRLHQFLQVTGLPGAVRASLRSGGRPGPGEPAVQRMVQISSNSNRGERGNRPVSSP